MRVTYLFIDRIIILIKRKKAPILFLLIILKNIIIDSDEVLVCDRSLHDAKKIRKVI